MSTLNKLIIVIIVLVSMSAGTLYSQLITGEELALIENVLIRAGLDLESLNFEKDWGLSTELKVDKITEILNNPLQFPDFADGIKEIIEDREIVILSEYLSEVIFAQFLETGSSPVLESSKHFERFFSAYVSNPADLIDYGLYLFEVVKRYYNKAMYQLTDTDKKALTYLSYSMWTDSGDRERYEKEADFLSGYKELFSEMKRSDYRDIILKVDWAAYIRAKMVFLNGAEVLKENIGDINFDNQLPIERESKWGRFVIGTTGDDIYPAGESNIAFLIEPGGNDIYRNDFYTDFHYPFYLILDLGGNDIWRNESIGGLFRVLGGIGWSASLGGNDIYEAGDMAFSSFMGFQYHQKESGYVQQTAGLLPETSEPPAQAQGQEGNDIYRTGRYTQGAATFGISININTDGNNLYNTTGYGQGFGGTLGAGLLIDYKGHDTYYAGGKYLHAPLRPDDHRSMSQGFGFGVRPDWGGGIGILYDGDGNDSYTGAVYAQGVGYWYALGMLLDGGGNDTFRAVQYAQGSGIHLAGGLLYNESGDDSYYSRFGPGQGAGHDYAIGFMIDRAGDDHYSIDGGNGLGLTNSVGIFLDVEGNDRYERFRNHNYGFANQARDSGGIGIFLDTGGDDIYSDSLWTNDSFWVRGTYGIGLDTTLVETEEEEKAGEELDIEDELAAIDTMTVVADLFRIASEWQVGSSIERVNRARKRILDFEEEAAEYIFENKLGSQSGLEHRAILAFADESEIFPQYLDKGLSAEDTLAVKNSISFSAHLKREELFPHLREFLDNNKYVPTIILSLSAFKTDEAVDILKTFIDSPSERRRFLTARSLKAIDTEKSKEILMKMKDDKSFLVRTTVHLAFPDKKGTTDYTD